MFAQSGTTGNLNWNLSDNGVLTVSGVGNMPDYESEGTPWYKYKSDIKEIIINNGVRNIGSYAFYNCFDLTSVTIPNSVTEIGKNAFRLCFDLTSINIPYSVTNIDETAFSVCNNLKSISVASGNRAYIDVDGVLFSGDKTRIVTFPAGRTGAYSIPDGVTGIGNYAFYSCENLTAIIIPATVTNISQYAFSSCKRLSDITVHWETPVAVDAMTFNGVKASATLYVPANSRSLYRETEGWKRLNIVEQNGAAPVNNRINNRSNNDYAEISWQLNNSVVRNKHFIVKACITSKSPVETVSVTVNGRSFRGTNVVRDDGCDFLLNQAVSLFEGGNIIRIDVKNAAGSIYAERRVELKSAVIKRNEKRYALVIGNAAYISNPLKNPVNDAVDIAAKLRKLNFEVTLLTDKNKREMVNAINNIAIKAKGYDAVMFFYAGHGIQSKNRNYLVPVNTKIINESDLEFDCVDVSRVMAKMADTRCNIKMIVLDACRNNPFERSWRGSSGQGLSSMNAPTGTLIAYSTAPNTVAADGSTGRNSPYTGALLSVLDEKLLVEILFKRVAEKVVEQTGGKQAPWVASSLIGDFYFTQ